MSCRTLFMLICLSFGMFVQLVHADKNQDFLQSIETGNMQDFEKLLKKGASPDAVDKDKHSALLLAIYNNRPEMLKELIAAKANLNVIWPENNLSPVLLAIFKKSPEMAKMLVDAGADVKAVDKDGLNALWWAAESEYSELGVAVAKAGADPNHADSDNGYTPLITTAENGDAALAQAIINAKANLNIQDKNGLTALIWASQKGHADVVKALLAGGADSKITDSKGFNALHAAASEGKTEAVQVLIQGGADINAKTKDGGTALLLATQAGHTDTAEVLKKAGAK